MNKNLSNLTIKKCGTNSIRQIYNKSLFSFMDYNVKKKSRKMLYIITDKFRSRGHRKEATYNFAYVLKDCRCFPGGPVADSMLQMQGGQGSIPGQGNRSHLPQLRVCMLQLKD